MLVRAVRAALGDNDLGLHVVSVEHKDRSRIPRNGALSVLGAVELNLGDFGGHPERASIGVDDA